MKLFTSAIDKQLFSQYSKGNDLSSQKVVAKIFNPYGRGTWYLINSDASDPDYIWAIIDLFEVEVGSVSRSELENVKVPPFRLPLERDLSFTPMNAEELLNGLMQGNRYAKGGVTKYQNDIEVIEARDGSNFLFPESNYPKNVGILLADGGCMAEGGEIKWQDAYRGDNALVIAENKLGVIVKPYGRKFHLRFPDGSEKTYDASELKFIKDDEEYADGGEIKKYPKNYKTKSNRGINPKYNYALLQLNKNGDVLLMGTYTKSETAESQKTFWEKNYAYPQEVNKWVIDELVESKMAKGGELGVTYFIGKPEVDKIGRFGKKRASWKTCLVNERGEKNYSEYTTSFVGSLSDVKLDGIKISQSEFDKLNFDKEMAMGGKLDVGRYYKTKDGRQVRYLGNTKDPELGTFMNKADGVFKVRYDEIEGSASLFAEGGEMKKGGIIGDLHSLTDELLAQKIQIFIDKIKPIKYYYIDEDSNSLIIGLDENYTQDAGDKLYKEATSSMEFFDANSVYMRYIPHKKQTEYSIKLKKVAKFAKGGEMEEGVDLFEDYENIPAKVQKILDENSVAFEDGDYRDLEKAVKELEKIGYTFEYDLDGQAYDLRKIGQKGKSEVGDDKYADGGEVGALTADEAIYLYIKKAINQPYREKYLKPAGLWNTPKMKEVEESLKKKGYLNGAGAINETGKNKAREVDASIDMIISRRYISSTNIKATYLEILEKFQGNDKMERGGEISDENKEMLKNQSVEIMHHAKELEDVVKKANEVEPWVISKVERSATDLSDVTHYLDGESKKMAEGGYMAKGSVTDFGDFYEWSGKEVKKKFGSGFDEGFPIVKFVKYSKNKEVENASGVLENGKTVVFNVDSVEWELSDKMAMGGKVKFADKVKSIKSSLLKRKKVSPKVQKDYGKTYSPKEAEESAKRIVGAMRKKMMGESK